MLDLNDIAIKLKYKLFMGDDEDNRATIDNKDNGAAEAADTENGAAGFGDGPVNEEGDEELTEEDAKRDKSQRKNKDPTNDWESLQLSDLPHGSGSDKDDGSEDLGGLDGSNGEEDVEGPVKKFIKRSYHEFNPRHDLQDPVFRLGMEFSSVDVFRKAIRAHSVKHRKVVKFKKNNPNRIRVVCKDEGCPKVMKFVEKINMENSVCNPAYCGNHVFQVKETEGEQFMVNIE
ncbi:hypothetical protein Q3G72_018308 [Acer saccharum]|nr:hypothetical protein Q3G72_018308 [Acer saccharum]